MRRAIPLLALLCLAFAPAPFPRRQPPDAAGRRDLQAMQGVWAERFADSAAVTITGDRMEYHPDHAWKLTLHARADPRRVAATGVGSENAGKTRVGLYRLEKGKLIICWRRDSAGKLEWPSSLDPFHKDVWIEVFTLVKP
jgi:uncharacterized protein (TIGR03067 family)